MEDTRTTPSFLDSVFDNILISRTLSCPLVTIQPSILSLRLKIIFDSSIPFIYSVLNYSNVTLNEFGGRPKIVVAHIVQLHAAGYRMCDVVVR